MNDTTRLFNDKIEFLQLKLDSLTQSQNFFRLQYELNQKQDLISQVNDFYDSAWLKLILVISVLGILVPIMAQYFQRKNLKDLSEFIRQQMNDSFDRRIEELERFNQNRIEQELTEFKDRINEIETKNENLLTELDASTYYLQGRASVLSKQYQTAIPSFLKSAYLFLASERPERARVQFVNLKICLKTIKDPQLIEDANQQMEASSYAKSIDEMISYFEEHELKTLYEEQLDIVIQEITRIRKMNNKPLDSHH